ncbi:ABC transporter ATP-binding protein/permease [uncultured Mitsuokella sp.]|uniref:ABC transporter ATP-binding protein/permease n=1 Tax=uncultured Mitsuokella sp. TaxID=453120 RepID=UPI0026DAE22E|nr:ATP-binding cassette domain-containing protein [uncultured Mitsuokella sp.]
MNMKQTFLFKALHEQTHTRNQLFLTELLRAMAVLGACGAASLAINQVFLGKGSLTETAPVLLVLFLVLGLLHLLALRQDHLLQGLSAALRHDVRHRLHLRLLSPEGQTDRSFRRQLLPLALESTDALDAWFTKVLPVVLGILVAMPCLLIAAFFIDPVTGLLMLITVPIAPFLLYLIGRVTKEASQQQWRQMNRFSAGLAEILRALPTLKLFARERDERRRVRMLSQEFAQAALRVLQLSFVSAFALELITTLAIAIIAVSIGLRLLYGQLTFTAAFFVLLLTPEFYQPLRLSGTAFHSGMTAFTAEQALRPYCLTPGPAPAADKGSCPAGFALAAQDLSFRYAGSPLPLMNGVHIAVKHGGMTVLHGPSGCGKTTLIRLLAGLLMPEAGTILRRQTSANGWSYVPQEPHLYNGTLLENVTLFHEECREDDALQALRRLDLTDMVRGLPQGLDTPLGEGGQNLSQGQRKRLGLARALLQDRPLLLLDEPTAALDEETAAIIRAALLSLRGSHTLFVISHDEALQKAADQLLAWDDITGENDTHQEGDACI